jgi:hypothetical protein
MTTNEGVTSAGMPFGSTVCVSPVSSGASVQLRSISQQLLSPEGSRIFMGQVFTKKTLETTKEAKEARKRNIAATLERNEMEEEGSLCKRNECMALFHGSVVKFLEHCVNYYDGSLLAFKAPGGYLKGFPTLRNFQTLNYNDDWIVIKKKELQADFNQVVSGSSLESLLGKYGVASVPELKDALKATYRLVVSSPATLGTFVAHVDTFFEEQPISKALMGAGGKNNFRQQYGDRKTRMFKVKDFLKNQKQREKLGSNKPKKGKPGARDPSKKKEEIWDETDGTEEEELPNESAGTT